MSTKLEDIADPLNMEKVINEWIASPPLALDSTLTNTYIKTLDHLLEELEIKKHNQKDLKKLHTTLSIFSDLQTKATDLKTAIDSGSPINTEQLDKITTLQNELNNSLLSQDQKIKRFFWILGAIVVGFAAGLVAGASCGVIGCIGGAIQSAGGLAILATPAAWIAAAVITGIAAVAAGCGFAWSFGHKVYEAKTNEYNSKGKANFSNFFTKITIDAEKTLDSKKTMGKNKEETGENKTNRKTSFNL